MSAPSLIEIAGYTEPGCLNDRARLSYQVGCLEGFLKYGLPILSTIEIKDKAGFDAAVEAAIKRIALEAKVFAGNYGK